MIHYFADTAAGPALLSEIWGGYDRALGKNVFTGRDQAGARFEVSRVVSFKDNPSLHKCDRRCLNAKRPVCECECRGANHGAGAFLCAAA